MGREIDNQCGLAFNQNEPFKQGQTEVLVSERTTTLQLYGHIIAQKKRTSSGNTLHIDTCGYKTATTLNRLRAIEGVNVIKKSGKLMLNGQEWNGSRTKV